MKRNFRTLTEKLFDYTCKVTGQSVSYEFSQQGIISIIHVLCKAKLLQRSMKLPKILGPIKVELLKFIKSG